jgi:hypothetical protein
LLFSLTSRIYMANTLNRRKTGKDKIGQKLKRP